MRALATALLVAAALASCSAPPPATQPEPQPAPACPEGKGPRSEQECDWLVADACPAGSRPALGTSACVPVGWRDCGAGFAPDPDGWGCTDVLAGGPCVGATYPALGSSSCAPIGACSAPFPPPEATLFVDDDGPVDATHFRLIIDAVAAAPSGATIAVAPGTYFESVELSRPVKLVGRCAAQVVVDVNNLAYPGLQVVSGATEVRGITIRHADTGVAVVGGSLTLGDAVVEQSTRFGVVAKGAGTKLVARRVVVRNTAANSTATTGWGAYALAGAAVDFADVTISDSVEAGVGAFDSTLTLARTAILDTRPNAKGELGHGLEAQDTPVTANGLLVAGATGVGVQFTGARTAAQLSRVVVRDVAGYSATAGGRGVSVVEGARLALTDAVVRDTDEVGLRAGSSAPPTASAVLTRVVVRRIRGDKLPQLQPGMKQFLGWGAEVNHGSKLELHDTAIVDVTELGLGVFDPTTTLLLEGSLVASVRANPEGLLGRGLTVVLGGTAKVVGSAFVAPREVALECSGAGSVVTLDKTLVRDVALSAAPSGHGAIGNYCRRLDVSASRFERAPGAALAFVATPGVISDTEFAACGVGVHTQAGSSVRMVSAPEAPIGVEVLVTDDCRFDDVINSTSGGDLALPPPLARSQ